MDTLNNLQAPQLDVNVVFMKMYQIVQFFISGDIFIWWEGLRLWLMPFSLILSIGFLAGIIYSRMRINQIEEQVQLARKQKAVDFGFDDSESEGSVEKNPRWTHIEALMSSFNEADWRTAIIEADIMLDEVITKMGYHGETLGEKMKGIEKSDFTSINEAWEAHKVRNHLAHQGSTFILTQREAERVIALYKKVFDEFEVI